MYAMCQVILNLLDTWSENLGYQRSSRLILYKVVETGTPVPCLFTSKTYVSHAASVSSFVNDYD